MNATTKIMLLFLMNFLITGCVIFNKTKIRRVYDVDKNVYTPVKIGNQYWLRENLKATHFNNGDPILEVKDNATWSKLKNAAFCNYNNDTTAEFGRYYNYFTVIDERNVCPSGWHVPNNSDWLELQSYLGYNNSAICMKDTVKKYWTVPNYSTNSSGFSGIPMGCRGINGQFEFFGRVAFWWSIDEYNSENGHRYDVDGTRNEGHLGAYYKKAGLSVRCIKK